jgi:hypothetical protein
MPISTSGAHQLKLRNPIPGVSETGHARRLDWIGDQLRRECTLDALRARNASR